MVNQSCGIVAERLVVRGRRWYHRIRRWRLFTGCQW